MKSKFPEWCPWQEKYDKAKKEAVYQARSRDLAWTKLSIANQRLKKHGLPVVSNDMEEP